MNRSDRHGLDNTQSHSPGAGVDIVESSEKPAGDLFADLEATLDEVAESNPRLADKSTDPGARDADLKALLEVSMAVNSSLVIGDVLQLVMMKAIEMMQAERGLIMLIGDDDDLQIKAAYNLCQEDMLEENFKISSSIAREVAQSGRSVYSSDAQNDERFAQQQSVIELHLRSIMCVPIKVKEKSKGKEEPEEIVEHDWRSA